MADETPPQQNEPKEPLKKMGCLPIILMFLVIAIGIIGAIYINFLR